MTSGAEELVRIMIQGYPTLDQTCCIHAMYICYAWNCLPLVPVTLRQSGYILFAFSDQSV